MAMGLRALALLLTACTPHEARPPPVVADAAVAVAAADAGRVDPACSGDRVDLTYVSLLANCGSELHSARAFARVPAPKGALWVAIDGPRRLAPGAEATVTVTFTSASDGELEFSVATEFATIGLSGPDDRPPEPATSIQLRPSLRDRAGREWGPPSTLPPSTRNLVHLAAHGTAVLRARFRAMGWIPGKRYDLVDPDSPPSRLPPGRYTVHATLPVDGVDALTFELDVGPR